MIERLLESDGADAESRLAVARFAAGMRGSWTWRFHSLISKPGNKITGQTNLGTVQVEDEHGETRETSVGEREVRIGQYKLVRLGREVEITHFWKSDLGTFSETEQPEAWRLCMNRQGEPIWFGARAIRHLFTLPVAGRYVTLVVTQELFVKRWATEGPEVRTGALGIQLYVSNG